MTPPRAAAAGAASPGGPLARYRDLWLWMIVPMAVMQVGIYHDYWGDFSSNAWIVHIHYWAATLWYLALIAQPWLIAHGQVERHRTVGMLSLFLAGGVALTALGALHRDIVNADTVAAQPGIFGPFTPDFFLGIAAVELVMMGAFILAVVQAVRHRRSPRDHAWWLVSTVFLIMMPTLARGVQFVALGTPGLGAWQVVYGPIAVTTAAILALLFAFAARLGTLAHPATWLAAGVNLLNLCVGPLGASPLVEGALRAAIKG